MTMTDQELLDQFAVAAMQALIAIEPDQPFALVAKEAYDYAAAMLAERAKRLPAAEVGQAKVRPGSPLE